MTPLVLLHAITRNGEDFAPFLPHLEAFDPHPVDLLGHGKAPRSDTYNLRTYAAAVPVPDRPFALYGHSLGGVVALAIAAENRNVRALVLEDPPLWDSQPPRLETTRWAAEFAALHHLMTRRYKGFGADEWRTVVGAWPSGHGNATIAAHGGAPAVARRARQIAALDPAVLSGILKPTLQQGFDVLAAIRACRARVTVLCGERARGAALAPDDLGVLSAEPNVTLVRAPGAGHYVREHDPALCAATLTAAL
ncbi:MAG: alpha/beta fold hydrolase [Pseudomonadota bacterium]